MIKIYSMKECPYCTKLKTLLTNEGVQFTDVDIDLPENEEEYKKIYEFSKCDEVPIIRIDKTLFIPNKSFSSIEEAFKLIKEFSA